MTNREFTNKSKQQVELVTAREENQCGFVKLALILSASHTGCFDQYARCSADSRQSQYTADLNRISTETKKKAMMSWSQCGFSE